MAIKIKSILRKLLAERDITPAQLARATQVPPQTINNWLSGLEPRNLGQLKLVADYFEISVDFLVYGIPPKEALNEPLKEFEEEINAGTFEVVLRRVHVSR